MSSNGIEICFNNSQVMFTWRCWHLSNYLFLTFNYIASQCIKADFQACLNQYVFHQLTTMSNLVFFLLATFATACLAVQPRRDDKVTYKDLFLFVCAFTLLIAPFPTVATTRSGWNLQANRSSVPCQNRCNRRCVRSLEFRLFSYCYFFLDFS